jgi:tripartite-type tricarboxylate transporter receptor subunit TctC
MKRSRFSSTLAACALVACCAVQAQPYPTKPVRIVVTSPVGSTPDVLARAVGAKLTESLKQPVVVDVRLGAGGNIGYENVARSPADGYSLVLAGNSLLTNPSLYKTVPYDVARDFAPISYVAGSQNALVVHPSVEAHSVQELIALARKRPGELSFGSAGSGTPLHLAGEMFNLQAGVKLVHVPYKGSSFATTDLLAGRIQAIFTGVVSFIPQIKAGKLRALAVTGTTRSPLMPDVPTFAEAGMPDYDIEVWFGLYGPAGMPTSIVQRLNDEIALAAGDPDLNTRLNALGLVFAARRATPEQFGRQVRAEMAKMAQVVKASGATAE